MGYLLKLLILPVLENTDDIVEKIGVDKAKDIAKDADLIIYVVDGSRELDENDKEILNIIKDKHAIVLINKSDIENVIDIDDLDDIDKENVIIFSAKNGIGMEAS